MTDETVRKAFAHRLQVRFRDCDAMGHVNHAVYFTYMEQARFAFARWLLDSDEPMPFDIILVRAECDFRAQATHGVTLEVDVRVTGIGRASFTLEYDVVDAADRRLVASGRSVQVAFDYGTQRSMPIPAGVRARLERVLVP